MSKTKTSIDSLPKIPQEIRDEADDTQALAPVEQLIRIETQEDFEEASDFRANVVRPMIDKIKEHCKPAKSLAFKLHRQLCADEKTLLEEWEKADRLIAKALSKYAVELEQRQAAERRRLEEASRRAAQEAADRETIALAQDALEDGDEAAARRILASLNDEESKVLAPTIPSETVKPKASTATVRMTWDFEITDRDRIKREYMLPDEKTIRSLVKRRGKDAVKIVGDGIRVFRSSSVGSRRS